jgi:hypothetical protein
VALVAHARVVDAEEPLEVGVHPLEPARVEVRRRVAVEVALVARSCTSPARSRSRSGRSSTQTRCVASFWSIARWRGEPALRLRLRPRDLLPRPSPRGRARLQRGQGRNSAPVPPCRLRSRPSSSGSPPPRRGARRTTGSRAGRSSCTRPQSASDAAWRADAGAATGGDQQEPGRERERTQHALTISRRALPPSRVRARRRRDAELEREVAAPPAAARRGRT